jgi:tetratricopeptide (TPR) repeat protein
VLGVATEEDLDHLRAVASDPARVRAAEGILALARRDAEAARRALEEATSLNPSLEEAWEALARAWLAGPWTEESCGRAEAAASAGLERDRGCTPLLIARGDARAARARLRRMSGKDPTLDVQAAEEDFGTALALGHGPEAQVRRGRLRVALGVHRMELGESPQGAFEAAAKDLQAVLAKEPRNAEAWGARAELARRRMELRGARGESPAEEWKALAPRDEAAPAEVWLHQGAGRGVLALWKASRGEDGLGELDAALGLLEEALKRSPDDREALEQRGRLRVERARMELRKGRDATADLERARADLERAGAALPLARAWRLRGEIELAHGSDASAALGKARELLDVLLRANPLAADAWVERGHAEMATGQMLAGDRAAAVEHFTQAVRSFEEARRINGLLEDGLREPLREARRALLGSD